jgi:HK97 gp10 family phage protein
MMKVKIEGLTELREALMQLPEELRKGPRKKAVTAAAIVVRDNAKSRVPVLKQPKKGRKPGTLRNAIRVGWSKMGSSSVQDMVNVFVKELSKGASRQFKKLTGKASNQNPDDPFYWKVWEFGNGINNSRPFLRPAFDSKKYQAVTVMASAMWKAIERAAMKVRKFRGR